ncbi:hypothetical protein UA08_05580 [Talaromyces atroroseus]|uniref:Uncharacterized protein n=1 Tax=Talaromyces atroroseus TaxID=1441469 RepID=A0A225ACE4_TALAT|nr:hypothetical protein UA08_05580 [Talaromyces atroroseus]OKL58762.1 hypothetical protein UA08_05580 [Talaromyces atroroseus]
MDGDEKVHREVITMQFIKIKTKIPVPSIITWGRAADNPLGLGPYIIMEFIDGLPLDEIVRQRTEDYGYTLRSDMEDRELETIFRQVANIYLELSSHNFPHIGALSNPSGTEVQPGPLSLEINEIESHGGIRVGHLSVALRLESTFRLLNKIYNTWSRSQILSTIRRTLATKYNYGPFKLICDDLRYGNILVNNKEELRIVAVLDWEWAYAAPYQCYFRLHVGYCSKDHQIRTVQIFSEEDDKRGVKTSMGVLMQQSLYDGKFWFHELVYSCFGFHEDVAWSSLRETLPDLDKVASVEDTKIQLFVEAKIKELQQCDLEWAAMKERIDKENAEFKAKLQRIREETGDLEISEVV